MTRTRADDGRVPTDLMLEYYVQRATAGLIVTECSPVRADSAGIMRAPGIYTEAHVEGWKKITEAVHDAGGKMYLQIWHGGRISHPSLQPDGSLPIAPSAIAASGQLFTANGPIDFPTPRALELSEIAPLIEAFGAATANAKRAGFDGVELHGAFGYLPDQFLQDGTNTRTDTYGGSIENRARFMLETVEAMIGEWDAERVGVKLSPSTRFYGQRDSDALATYSYVVTALDALNIGYIHVMEPTSNDLSTGTVQIENTTAALRPFFKGTMITNGGYDVPKAEAALADGTADLVSFGVPFIANPDLVKRFKEGAELNVPDPMTFYGFGPKGYTDYPSLAA
jgi:N-ethylmaleimide reductase